jgi:flagella synthesis protein FlgN
MAAWLTAAADPAAQAAWSALLQLAGQARDLNALNGKLIAERLRHNQQALAILLAAGDQAALYGPDGQTRLAGSGRPLGSA